jgi:hypothetical protein
MHDFGVWLGVLATELGILVSWVSCTEVCMHWVFYNLPQKWSNPKYNIKLTFIHLCDLRDLGSELNG